MAQTVERTTLLGEARVARPAPRNGPGLQVTVIRAFRRFLSQACPASPASAAGRRRHVCSSVGPGPGPGLARGLGSKITGILILKRMAHLPGAPGSLSPGHSSPAAASLKTNLKPAARRWYFRV